MTLEIERSALDLDADASSVATLDDEIERLRGVLQISQIAAWEWDVSTS